MSVSFGWPVIAGVVLLAGGIITLAASFLPSIARTFRGLIQSTDDEFQETSSDDRPPEGFTDHVERIIAATAPNCPPDVRLQYLRAGYTEAQTLAAEVDRLSQAGGKKQESA